MWAQFAGPEINRAVVNIKQIWVRIKVCRRNRNSRFAPCERHQGTQARRRFALARVVDDRCGFTIGRRELNFAVNPADGFLRSAFDQCPAIVGPVRAVPDVPDVSVPAIANIITVLSNKPFGISVVGEVIPLGCGGKDPARRRFGLSNEGVEIPAGNKKIIESNL